METKGIGAPAQAAAGELALDEGVAGDVRFLEACRQPRASAAQMIDPHGGVDEDHAEVATRLRRMRRSCFSLPPSAARRLALSRAMSASRPA